MDKRNKNVYNPKEIEERYYQIWEKRGYFEIEGKKIFRGKEELLQL